MKRIIRGTAICLISALFAMPATATAGDDEHSAYIERMEQWRQ